MVGTQFLIYSLSLVKFVKIYKLKKIIKNLVYSKEYV